MLNVACMQKIKIGHRAKFRDKDKCFLQLLFPVRAILRCISTSCVLRALLLIEILTNFADAYILVMAWMGYARARLKTLSSLLKAVIFIIRRSEVKILFSFLIPQVKISRHIPGTFVSLCDMGIPTKGVIL